MPFTVSHVAAVLPAYRPLTRWHVLSAAVIGSMAPDLGMMLPASLARWQTHSLQALLSFCLPIGLLTYWLTQLLLKPAILEVLPDRGYVRLRREHPPVSTLDLRVWLYASIAILFGALTHLIWDGFTHEDAHGVRMFPVLSDYEVDVAGHVVTLYRWLQYGSSIVGLAVVIAALWLWFRHSQRIPVALQRRLGPAERTAWIAVYVALPVLLLALAIVRPWSMGHFPFANGNEISRLAVAAMRGGAISLVLVSALIRVRLAL